MSFMAFMAGLALTFFWVHTLLIAAAGLIQSRKLWRRAARLRGGLTPARVVSGAGEGGAIARHGVEQVGRSRGDGHVWFHDRGTRSEAFGGELTLEGVGQVRVDAEARVEVWPDPVRLAARAAEVDADRFEAAVGPATKARGFVRQLHSPVEPGAAVWVHGEIEDGKLLAPDGEAILISTIEPLGWLARKARAGVWLAALELGLAAGCTVLIFWPPMWGTVSMIGAFSALVVFNLFQLWGKLLRDGVRVPSEAFVRGHWARPG